MQSKLHCSTEYYYSIVLSYFGTRIIHWSSKKYCREIGECIRNIPCSQERSLVNIPQHTPSIADAKQNTDEICLLK